jgi:hypothetical protein
MEPQLQGIVSEEMLLVCPFCDLASNTSLRHAALPTKLTKETEMVYKKSRSH